MPAIEHPDQFVFYCRSCFEVWDADGLDLTTHCTCGRELTSEPRHSWMNGVCAAHKAQQTPEAKAKMALGGARSHGGPSTPEAKLRSSMNAWKNGSHATKHFLPPARPGEYRACLNCPYAPAEIEWLSNTINPQPVKTGGNNDCSSKKFRYCTATNEILLQVIHAHKNGGPAALKELIGGIHGFAMASLIHALQDLMSMGPLIESDIFDMTKDGGVVKLGTKLEANPAVSVARDLASILKIPLEQFELTPKSTTEREQGNDLRLALSEMFKINQPPRMPGENA